jgi:hypothetical protein
MSVTTRKYQGGISISKSTAMTGLALFAILAAAIFVRLYRINRESLWFDEMYTVYLACGRGTQMFELPAGRLMDPPPAILMKGAPSWPHVWTGMSAVPYTPLYHIFLRWWMDLFGDNDLSSRGFSTFCSVAGVLVLFDAVRRSWGSLAALAAAWVMALAISNIDYSQEARGYTMMVLLGLIALHAMVRIENDGASAGGLAQLGFAVSASLLTHYFMVFPFVGMGIYALVKMRGPVRRRMLWTMAIAIVATALVWSPQYWRQHQYKVMDPGSNSWQYDRTIGHGQLLAEALQGPALHLFADQSILLAVATAVLVFLVPIILRRKDPRRLLWWSWMMGAIGCLFAFDLMRNISLTGYARFSLVATAAIYPLAIVPMPLRGWRAWIISFAVLAGVTAEAAGRLQGPSAPCWPMAPQRGDMREFIHQVDRIAGPREPIVLYEPSQASHMNYVSYSHFAPDAHRPVMILESPAGEAAQRKLAAYSEVVVVFGDFIPKDSPPPLPGWQCVQSFGVAHIGSAMRMIPPATQK